MRDVTQIFHKLSERFAEKIVRLETQNVDPWIEVESTSIALVGFFLRDEADLLFRMLNCITAVDYPPSKIPDETNDWGRLELIYHLTSLDYGSRLVLKVVLPRWKDNVPGRLPEVPTVSPVWPTATWHEREIFDLMGVYFVGHPDLRRILCPEDWEGHPLRKDYEMPREYHGIPLK